MEYIDDRSCQVEKHAQIYNFSKLTLFELAWQLAIEFHARNRERRFPKKFIEKGNALAASLECPHREAASRRQRGQKEDPIYACHSSLQK
jgi:hypothetical protein